jgi:magnesium transporter
MAMLTKKRSKKAGLSPGTPVHIGELKTEKVKITAVRFNASEYEETDISIGEDSLPSFPDPSCITWINVDGIHDLETIEKIGRLCKLHPLTLEDMMNTDQRPKLEEYGDYFFLVLKMIHPSQDLDQIDSEQVSIIVRPNLVLSLREKESDIFNPVRDRLKTGKGRLRQMGSDYLAYTLMDTIVDQYFLILEKLGERIEFLQDELVANPKRMTLQKIHHLKREMIFLRRAIWPLREVLGRMERGESPLIQETTLLYLRDLYDHTIQVIDAIETFREMLSGMVDIYLSSISNRLNEVMKVLTIIATIFIPLTFIAGVYGMNFKYMPELEWKWGYPAVLLLMAAVGLCMLIFFRKRKWF